MPFFSVIIPVYDRPNLLIRAVDSVERQTFSDWECHLIDDGSSTPHPLGKEFSIRSSGRINYHYFSDNRGVSWARNQGFHHAQGEWIAFLDSDDEWMPEKLSAAQRFIAEHPELKIFQSEEFWIRKGKRVNIPDHLRKPSGDIFQESLERCLITTSSVVIHHSLLEVAPWDETLPTCEDYDLWIRLTSTHSVGLLPLPLTTRYQDYGGRQLSQEYPIMDRFRLQSLKKFIRRSGDKEKQRMAGEVLKRKSKIVMDGALKRKNFSLYFKVFFSYRLWYHLLG